MYEDDELVLPDIPETIENPSPDIATAEEGVIVEYLDENPLPEEAFTVPLEDTTEPFAEPVPVGASDYEVQTAVPSVDELDDFTLMDLVQMAVVYAFIIAAALSAVYIFIGGISFILSGGNDEKIKQAINTIRYAIIGLIITILSFTFVTIVGRMFGLNFMDYLSYKQVKNSINKLLSPFSNKKETQSFEIRP